MPIPSVEVVQRGIGERVPTRGVHGVPAHPFPSIETPLRQFYRAPIEPLAPTLHVLSRFEIQMVTLHAQSRIRELDAWIEANRTRSMPRTRAAVAREKEDMQKLTAWCGDIIAYIGDTWVHNNITRALQWPDGLPYARTRPELQASDIELNFCTYEAAHLKHELSESQHARYPLDSSVLSHQFRWIPTWHIQLPEGFTLTPLHTSLFCFYRESRDGIPFNRPSNGTLRRLRDMLPVLASRMDELLRLQRALRDHLQNEPSGQGSRALRLIAIERLQLFTVQLRIEAVLHNSMRPQIPEGVNTIFAVESLGRAAEQAAESIELLATAMQPVAEAVEAIQPVEVPAPRRAPFERSASFGTLPVTVREPSSARTTNNLLRPLPMYSASVADHFRAQNIEMPSDLRMFFSDIPELTDGIDYGTLTDTVLRETRIDVLSWREKVGAELRTLAGQGTREPLFIQLLHHYESCTILRNRLADEFERREILQLLPSDEAEGLNGYRPCSQRVENVIGAAGTVLRDWFTGTDVIHPPLEGRSFAELAVLADTTAIRLRNALQSLNSAVGTPEYRDRGYAWATAGGYHLADGLRDHIIDLCSLLDVTEEAMYGMPTPEPLPEYLTAEQARERLAEGERIQSEVNGIRSLGGLGPTTVRVTNPEVIARNLRENAPPSPPPPVVPPMPSESRFLLETLNTTFLNGVLPVVQETWEQADGRDLPWVHTGGPSQTAKLFRLRETEHGAKALAVVRRIANLNYKTTHNVLAMLLECEAKVHTPSLATSNETFATPWVTAWSAIATWVRSVTIETNIQRPMNTAGMSAAGTDQLHRSAALQLMVRLRAFEEEARAGGANSFARFDVNMVASEFDYNTVTQSLRTRYGWRVRTFDTSFVCIAGLQALYTGWMTTLREMARVQAPKLMLIVMAMQEEVRQRQATTTHQNAIRMQRLEAEAAERQRAQRQLEESRRLLEEQRRAMLPQPVASPMTAETINEAAVGSVALVFESPVPLPELAEDALEPSER